MQESKTWVEGKNRDENDDKNRDETKGKAGTMTKTGQSHEDTGSGAGEGREEVQE